MLSYILKIAVKKNFSLCFVFHVLVCLFNL